MKSKIQSKKDAFETRISSAFKRTTSTNYKEKFLNKNKDILSHYDDSISKDSKPFFFTEKASDNKKLNDKYLNTKTDILKKEIIRSDLTISSFSRPKSSLIDYTPNFNLQKRKACNYEATFLNKIKNRKSGNRKIKILVEETINKIRVDDKIIINSIIDHNPKFIKENSRQERNIQIIDDYKDNNNQSKLREKSTSKCNFKTKISIQNQINSEKNDFTYNKINNTEEEDKIYLDDLKTHIKKEEIRNCLKEHVANDLEMNQFFKLRDNQVNFIFDNFHYPTLKNKLHSENQSKKLTNKFDKLEFLKKPNSIDKKTTIYLGFSKRKFQEEKDKLHIEYIKFIKNLEENLTERENLNYREYEWEDKIHSSKKLNIKNYLTFKHDNYKGVNINNHVKNLILENEKIIDNQTNLKLFSNNAFARNNFDDVINLHLQNCHKNEKHPQYINEIMEISSNLKPKNNNN